MNRVLNVAVAIATLPIWLFGGVALAREWTPQRQLVLEKKTEYPPNVDRHFPQRIFFGDTHRHTILSFDDGLAGTRLGPEDSFRFARGDEVVSNTGIRAKLTSVVKRN